MGTRTVEVDYYLYPGLIFAQKEMCMVTTVLGSCVSVCLWDPVYNTGGINHYMLPLWNGEGLPSPKYGNIAIRKLIEKMMALGCRKENLKAKVFGGGAVLQTSGGLLNVGERNIILAEDILAEEKIPIISRDVGGSQGRKLIFCTGSGTVLVKKILSRVENSK
ncbi:MAG: chemotaxis protein CheD [Nitrospirae bacterium]|nr:chemotaxis protein CheD [Nitrospirota bacterium]